MKQKRVLSVIVAALLIMSGVIAFIGQSEDNDSVEAAVPAGHIPVTNAADLARVGTGATYGGYTWSLGASYYQTADIALSGTNNHIPIGTQATPFTGIYDGNGRSLTGVNITTNSVASLGVFGYVSNGTIRNLNVAIVISTTQNTAVINAGGIAGVAIGTSESQISLIEGCTVSGSIYVRSQSGSVAGIAGVLNKGEIRNCSNSATVDGGTYTGGIVGQLLGYGVKRCYNIASVYAYSTLGGSSYTLCAGGIVGGQMTTASTISECYNSGTVSAVSDNNSKSHAGGIAGQSKIVNGIVNCYNIGNVTAKGTQDMMSKSSAGGITGNGGDGPWYVSYCYNTGNVSASPLGSSTTVAGAIAGNGTFNSTVFQPMVGCYYLSSASVSGTAVSAYGVSKTDAELKTHSTYTDWDFANIWNIFSGQYPVLRATIKEIAITSTPVTTVVAGTQWTYMPAFTPSDATVSISGVSWLSISSGKISGTAPAPSGSAESQTFSLIITVTKTGYTTAVQNLSLKVFRQLAFTTTPTASMTITPMGLNTFVFDASASTDYETISWDFGNGATSDGLVVQYTFPRSGVYKVEMTATNPNGSDVARHVVTLTDASPQTEAWVGRTYVFTPDGISGTPALTGASWLSWDAEHGRLSGTPSVSDIGSYSITLMPSSGDPVTWAIRVYPSSTVPPIAGFSFQTDGLKVTFLSSSSNATITYWSFGDGKHSLSADVEHTYDKPGTYTATLEVRNSEGVDVYSRIVTVTTPADDGGSGTDDGDKDLKDKTQDVIVEYLALVLIILGAALILLGGKWENFYVLCIGLAVLLISILSVLGGYLNLPSWLTDLWR